MLNQIVKWTSWALMLIGVILTVLVFTSDGSESSVNSLLMWAYVMLAVSILSILFGIYKDVIVNKKSLYRMLIIVGGCAVLVVVAYLCAPGKPAVGYVGQPISEGALKLTDTILNLTYVALIVAVGSIIVSTVMDRIKK